MTAIRDMLAAADQRPAFITLKAGHFLLAERRDDQLMVRILEFFVVRKRFVDRHLDCYSLDLRRGSKGTYCGFCPVRQHCQKRLRMLLLVIDDDQEQPAILEINYLSFDSLEDLVERVGRDNLAKTLVRLSVVDGVNGRYAVDFRELF